jgi:hypothetical protein
MIKKQEIEIVNLFYYLGCIISRDQRIDKEIESRLMKATSAFHILRNIIWHRKVISIDAKLRIFRACVLSVLLYGSEVWLLTMAQKSRITSFYIKSLRTVLDLKLSVNPLN